MCGLVGLFIDPFSEASVVLFGATEGADQKGEHIHEEIHQNCHGRNRGSTHFRSMRQ